MGTVRKQISDISKWGLGASRTHWSKWRTAVPSDYYHNLYLLALASISSSQYVVFSVEPTGTTHITPFYRWYDK
jgi:hypothetical protein